jgi:hypothetical protein
MAVEGCTMTSLVHCIYVSTASRSFHPHELVELVSAAREKNKRLNITGVLLYMGGRFFQVLEGESAAVEDVYASIVADTRHKEVTQIIFETISKRSFEDWSMSLVDLSGDKLDQILALSDPKSGSSSLKNLPEGRSKKLLLAFCEGRWGPTVVDRSQPMVI